MTILSLRDPARGSRATKRAALICRSEECGPFRRKNGWTSRSRVSWVTVWFSQTGSQSHNERTGPCRRRKYVVWGSTSTRTRLRSRKRDALHPGGRDCGSGFHCSAQVSRPRRNVDRRSPLIRVHDWRPAAKAGAGSGDPRTTTICCSLLGAGLPTSPKRRPKVSPHSHTRWETCGHGTCGVGRPAHNKAEPGHSATAQSLGQLELQDVVLAGSFADEVDRVAVGGPAGVVVVFGV
jgi:hypothetical protein